MKLDTIDELTVTVTLQADACLLLARACDAGAELLAHDTGTELLHQCYTFAALFWEAAGVAAHLAAGELELRPGETPLARVWREADSWLPRQLRETPPAA